MYEQLAPRQGLRVLEIGGGKSGLQFALDKSGCEVVNVDPGTRAHGLGWSVTPTDIARLNRRFGTHVDLRHAFIEEAHLPDDRFDSAVSVSVLEHIPERDLATTVAHVRRSLKPGGRFVLTVDLFLNLSPFTTAVSNRWGHNVSLAAIVRDSGMDLIHGDRSELCGFPEFDVERIIAERSALLVGGYEAAVQTLILRKRPTR